MISKKLKGEIYNWLLDLDISHFKIKQKLEDPWNYSIVVETKENDSRIISVIFNDKKIFQYETNKKETKFILDCDTFVKCDWILKKVAP